MNTTQDNAPLPIAIVGLGFGRWIVRGLQEEKMKKLFRVVALCDLDTAKAEEISKEIGGVRIATLDELLADPAVPVIGLFTGPAGRAEMLRKIIRAGKHVMTTKPFERDPEAVRPLFEEAAKLGKVIHLNSPAPVLPDDLACIRDWQQKYNLGRPVSAQIATWVRYNEEPTGNWLDDPALCPVAPIFRIGIYLINDAIELFGEADEVQVMSSRLFTKRPTPDHAQLSIRFKNGGLVSILASFCINDADCYRNALTLNFENGTVYRNAGAESKAGSPGANLSVVIAQDNKPVRVDNAKFDEVSGLYEWSALREAILTGKPPGVDYADKISAGLRVIEAMAESEKIGRPVKIKAV